MQRVLDLAGPHPNPHQHALLRTLLDCVGAPLFELALAVAAPQAMPERVRALLMAAHFKPPSLLHWLRVTADAAAALVKTGGACAAAILAGQCL